MSLAKRDRETLRRCGVEELIERWEKMSAKYHKLAGESDNRPMVQQGLYSASESYSVCASDLRRKLKENAK